MAYVSCENITLSYEGMDVVSNLSFDVQPGDYLCIVGENGSGKSTLLKGILGFVKASKGRIVYGDGILPNEIGYLPQQTSKQKDFPASVWEVVLSGCLNKMGIRPFYSKKEKDRAVFHLKKLGIEKLRTRSYNELSGGQQQRVLLARALCAAEKLLILDEPVSGLDPIVTADMYELIYRLNRDENMTIIMVSHDMKGALAHADKVLHMRHDGYFFGTLEEYHESPYYDMFQTGGGCR